MTGFGSACRTPRGFSVRVEAKSVNNRYLKLALRTPALLSPREAELQSLVKERVDRGSVQVHVRIEREDPPARTRFHAGVAEAYLRHLRRLAREAGTDRRPSLDLLATLPGVFSLEEAEGELAEETWEIVKRTFVQALDRMVRMRKREGASLRRDLGGRRRTVAGLVREIRRRAPAVAVEQLERLRARAARLLGDRSEEIREEDLHRELALLAERSDVSEELTRLASHLEQFERALREDGSVGRRLDFLVQEMAREANTISAKAADVEMSRFCVDLKVELDRMREQVQNVE